MTTETDTNKLLALAQRWQNDRDAAACIDGETGGPCEGMRQCAEQLEEALGTAETPPTGRQRPRASIRISTDKIHIDGGPGLSREHALGIANDILELLEVPQFAPAAHQERTEPPEIVQRLTEWLSKGGFFNPAEMAGANEDATRQLILDARTALGAPARAAEWQPIETAPKDADVLLLYDDRNGVQPGFWDSDLGWRAGETQTLTGGLIQPTHWMPLPPGALTGQQETKETK